MKLSGLIKSIQKLAIAPRIVVYVLIFIAFRFLLDALFSSLNELRIMKEGMENKEGKKFILFHWNKCGHCKKMMPEWNKFENNYKGSVNIGKVEKDEDPGLIEKMNIKGYPTILMLDENNNKIADYSGDRTVSAFMEFVKQY
jgi:thiol-disulfide isomerase/thioredoxin